MGVGNLIALTSDLSGLWDVFDTADVPTLLTLVTQGSQDPFWRFRRCVSRLCQWAKSYLVVTEASGKQLTDNNFSTSTISRRTCFKRATCSMLCRTLVAEGEYLEEHDLPWSRCCVSMLEGVHMVIKNP